MRIIRLARPFFWLGAAILLAAGAGFLSSVALGVGSAEPARTITIDVGAAGPTGPTGPAGPAGPPGLSCPSGYEPARVVFNTPQGHQAIWTCLE